MIGQMFGLGAVFNWQQIGLHNVTNSKKEIVALSKTVDSSLTSMQNRMAKFAGIAAVGGLSLLGGKKGLDYIDNAIDAYGAIETGQVQMASKLQKSKNEIKGLTDQIKSLGRETQFTGKEIFQTANNLLGFGVAEKMLPKAIEPVLDLAVAVGQLPDVSGKAVSGMKNVFSERSFREVADVLGYAKSLTAVGAGELGIAEFKYLAQNVSAVRSLIDISMEEATALFSFYRKIGMSEARAGQMVKMFGIGISKLTSDITKMNQLQKLSSKFGFDIQFRKANGELKPFADNVTQIHQLLLKTFKSGKQIRSMLSADQLSELSKQNITTDQALGSFFTEKLAKQLIPNQRSAMALLSVMGELDRQGTLSLKNLVKELENSQGFTKRMAGEMKKTWEGMGDIFEGLKASIRETFGESLIKYAKKGLGFVNKQLSIFAEYIDEHKKMTAWIATSLALASIFSILSGAIMITVGAIGMLSVALASYGGIMGVASVGFLAFGKGLLVFGAIAGAIALVGGFIYLIKNWNKLSPELQKGLKLSGLAFLIFGAGLLFANWQVALISVALTGLVAGIVYVMDNFELFKNKLTGIFKTIKDTFINAMADIVMSLPDWLVPDRIEQWAKSIRTIEVPASTYTGESIPDVQEFEAVREKNVNIKVDVSGNGLLDDVGQRKLEQNLMYNLNNEIRLVNEM